MSASFPPLPDELVEFMRGGVSLLIGTCSKDLVPESVRGAGLRIWPCACKITVLLPKATAEVAVEYLRTNPRLAMTASEIQTHRTVQVKGSVLEVREGDDEDHILALRYAAAFRKSLEWAGIPEGVTRGLTLWPAWAVDVEIAQVFAQTPGPLAGARMPLASGARVP